MFICQAFHVIFFKVMYVVEDQFFLS